MTTEVNDLDAITFDDIAAPTLTGAHGRPKAHRHDWQIVRTVAVPPEQAAPILGFACSRCGKPKDISLSRLGKNNRKRGNALELWFCRALGLEKVGQMGTETDGRTPEGYAGNALFVAQVKSGLQYPGWMTRILDTLPRTGGRVPILGIVQTPGPGKARRALVVMDISDFVALHGPSGGAE